MFGFPKKLKPNSWQLVDVDEPLVEIAEWPNTTAELDLKTTLRLSSTNMANLNNLLSSVPEWVQVVGTHSNSVYKVTFAPSVVQALSKGSAEIIPATGGGWRAVARDTTTKKIIGSGTLIPCVNSAATGKLVWDILSTITVQKHLSDINQRLSAIESKADGILEFLRTQEAGAIAGNYNYLCNIANTLMKGRSTEIDYATYNQRVEDIESDSLKTIHTTQSLLNGLQQKCKQTSNTNQISACLQDFEAAIHVFASALIVRVTAIMIKTLLPVDQTNCKTRFEDVSQYMEYLETVNSGMEENISTPATPVTRFAAMKLALSIKSPKKRHNDIKAQKSILVSVDQAIHQLRSSLVESEMYMQTVASAANTDLSLILEVGSAGKIVTACLLPLEIN